MPNYLPTLTAGFFQKNLLIAIFPFNLYFNPDHQHHRDLSFFILTKKIIRSRGIGFDEIGKERYMPTDLVMVPIMVNLMLIFGFIFIGAILFASWEGWSPTTAAYFCFVTLTTIGFGDYTPVKSFNGFEHDPVAAMKMVFTVSYCIFGMTLLSMCMNLMQEQIVEKVAA